MRAKPFRSEYSDDDIPELVGTPLTHAELNALDAATSPGDKVDSSSRELLLEAVRTFYFAKQFHVDSRRTNAAIPENIAPTVEVMRTDLMKLGVLAIWRVFDTSPRTRSLVRSDDLIPRVSSRDRCGQGRHRCARSDRGGPAANQPGSRAGVEVCAPPPQQVGRACVHRSRFRRLGRRRLDAVVGVDRKGPRNPCKRSPGPVRSNRDECISHRPIRATRGVPRRRSSYDDRLVRGCPSRRTHTRGGETLGDSLGRAACSRLTLARIPRPSGSV